MEESDMVALGDVCNKIENVGERILADSCFALNRFEECCYSDLAPAAPFRPYKPYTVSEK
jgi:hypothetical protein